MRPAVYIPNFNGAGRFGVALESLRAQSRPVDIHATGAESVAGILTQEQAPELIDSAGLVADRTLLGFDYPTESRAAAAGAPHSARPAAALYSRGAFDAVDGFDEAEAPRRLQARPLICAR